MAFNFVEFVQENPLEASLFGVISYCAMWAIGEALAKDNDGIPNSQK